MLWSFWRLVIIHLTEIGIRPYILFMCIKSALPTLGNSSKEYYMT